MHLRDVFVKNLRRYRKEGGVTQAALAERCGTSTSYIGQIEIGNRFPSLELIEKIARALRVRPHVLFFIEPDADEDEQTPKAEKDTISNAMKEELIKRLTDGICKIVKQMN